MILPARHNVALDAVIFDLDGTLVDTESLSLAAGLAAFASLGAAVDVEFLHRLVGKDRPACARLIRAHRPDLDLAALNQHWRAGFDQRIASSLTAKPGAMALVAALRLPLAVVTSSDRDGASYKLARAGLATAFAHVITLDDVTLAKPAPEPYLLAATRLAVAPARCVAFEDSEAGAEAAHAAGMVVVQVPDLLPTSGRFAHHVAPDLLTGARLVGLIA